MRVLLIDDLGERLDHLESALLDLKPDWRVSSAPTPREGVEIMAQDTFDVVVVANSRAPRMVVDVLAQARKRLPAALRIAVIDGEGAAPEVFKAEVAHRIVPAPLGARRLVDALRGLRALQDQLHDDGLRARIASLERLPQAPGVALALMRANAEGTAHPTAVAKRLHGDSVLTAKLLQLSNSAYYARGTPILQIERALTRLGMDTVIHLVLAVESFSVSVDRELQKRAVLSAQLTSQVLRDMRRSEFASIAATAATLADIGKLLPLGLAPAVRSAGAPGADDIDAPLPLASIAGAYLLTLWGLPWPIVEAVAYRHRPILAGVEEFGITAAVHTACALARGEPLDEGLLEAFDAMDFVPAWRAEAQKYGAPQAQEVAAA